MRNVASGSASGSGLGSSSRTSSSRGGKERVCANGSRVILSMTPMGEV